MKLIPIIQKRKAISEFVQIRIRNFESFYAFFLTHKIDKTFWRYQCRIAQIVQAGSIGSGAVNSKTV